jgi:hypothetical protein
MPIKPPAKTLPANPAAPVPGISLVRGMICGSYPSLLIVTVMSALRFACTTHGVTQAVGISRPDISAVAPAGVVEIEMFSVVPRVTDAQPKHGKAIAADNNNLITEAPPPAKPFTQPQRESKRKLTTGLFNAKLTLAGSSNCGPDGLHKACRKSGLL